MKNIADTFGCMVFDESAMKSSLPKDIYKLLKSFIKDGGQLPMEIADAAANAMKDCALAHGATHFTHWFQPMTGLTAEKHESFISPTGSGTVLMEFSGKALLTSDIDASSFPSGGLRSTANSRGYTLWDASSHPFIKGQTLYIPTVFCSYHGQSLDKKIPLLRSSKALEKQAIRVLKLLGHEEVQHVYTSVGAEQEYFLIDKSDYLKRADLVLTSRTLFGAEPPKTQQLDDHYLGSLKPRVAAFMKELDEELWKLGIPAKNKHNEVSPNQHELACVYTKSNLATDQNQLVMELMKNIADKHGLACLLHEKPFKSLNGSGKHNNWSITTNTGINLLDPGATPHENTVFLVFLAAVIKAVDDYQGLLRMSAAGAGNEHRLGAQEAPPAIISIFLGDELTKILDCLEKGLAYSPKPQTIIDLGCAALPPFAKDVTDRNRTSPFAFTGNKFEFRMPGSSMSIAGPNIVLNTSVAEILRQFADELETAADIKKAVDKILQKTLKQHKRILFNGDNYSPEWIKEAANRGLANHKTTPNALEEFIAEKSIQLFTLHKVFTPLEIEARHKILLESYTKTLEIEAATMAEIAKTQILPAALAFQRDLTTLLWDKKNCGFENIAVEEKLLKKTALLTEQLFVQIENLEELTHKAALPTKETEKAIFYSSKVFDAMAELRKTADELEKIVAKKYWPFPTYSQIFYNIY